MISIINPTCNSNNMRIGRQYKNFLTFTLLCSVLAIQITSAKEYENADSHFNHDTENEWYTIINIVGATVCVGFVALISCMFLGFLTLDVLDLQIKARAAIDSNDRRYASRLLPVVSQNHRMLVTLLLLNAIAYESLPLFLDNLIPSWAAILLSVTFLLIFGEVIPR